MEYILPLIGELPEYIRIILNGIKFKVIRRNRFMYNYEELGW